MAKSKAKSKSNGKKGKGNSSSNSDSSMGSRQVSLKTPLLATHHEEHSGTCV
jgi:hypothetical protein